MAHVPKEKRLKWDKKAKKHLLIGYGENVKSYRIYNPTKKIVNTSRDIIVMEKETEELVSISLNKLEDEQGSVSVGDSESYQSLVDVTDDSTDLKEKNFENNDISDREQQHFEVRRSKREPKPKVIKDYIKGVAVF